MTMPGHEQQQETNDGRHRMLTEEAEEEDMIIYEDIEVDIDDDSEQQQLMTSNNTTAVDREEGELPIQSPLLPTPLTPLLEHNNNIMSYSTITNDGDNGEKAAAAAAADVNASTTTNSTDTVTHHHHHPYYQQPYRPPTTSWRRQQYGPNKPPRRYQYATTTRKATSYRYRTDDSAYFRIKPDNEYVPPNAEKWFALAMEYANRRYGQDMLYIMFCKCPYTMYDLDKFITLLETHRMSVHAPADYSRIEMMGICTHIRTIYGHYETEQIKRGSVATTYVNRIITVRDIQNTYIDKTSSVQALRWFVSEWNRICGKTITNVMAIIDSQYQKMNKQRYY